MKKISYVLGLVAMVVMMTMTSCSNVSEDVQKVCDALNEGTKAIEDAESMSDAQAAVMSVKEDVDEFAESETELTEDDKEALKESLMGLNKAALQKQVELKDISQEDADKYMEIGEENLDKILEKSTTLGDLVKQL